MDWLVAQNKRGKMLFISIRVWMRLSAMSRLDMWRLCSQESGVPALGAVCGRVDSAQNAECRGFAGRAGLAVITESDSR
jgi:hypothetical protein